MLTQVAVTCVSLCSKSVVMLTHPYYWINVVAVDQSIPEYVVDLAAFASEYDGDQSFVEAEAAFEVVVISRRNNLRVL